MTSFAIYKISTGEITRSGSVPSYSINDQVLDTDEALIVGEYTSDQYYISSGTAIAYTEAQALAKASGAVYGKIWDNSALAWIDTLTLKDRMLFNLEEIAHTKYTSGCSYAGHTYPTDDGSRSKFAAAAVAYGYLGVSPPKLPKDGVDTYIAGANLASIVGAQETYFEAVKSNYDSLVVAINNAADDTALAAIDLTAGWP